MASLKVRIAESVQGLGPRLSTRLRWLGIWELALLISAAALVSLGLDVWLELPMALRAAALVSLIAGSVFLFLRARQRAGRAFELRELAAAVESRDGTLDGHLANVLDLPAELEEIERGRVTGRPGAVLEAQLLKKALAESTQRALRAPVSSALSGAPIWKRAAPAVLLIAALVYLSGSAPGTFRLWFERNVFLSSDLYPRMTHFVLDRPGAEWHVATKDPLEIGGWVTGEVPRQVEIHLESGSGQRTATLIPGAVGQVVPEPSERTSPPGNENEDDAATTGPEAGARAVEGRRIVHLLGSVTEPLVFRFEGGDNESRTVSVVAHDRPRITTARFTLRFPAYLGREASTVENPGGDLIVPAGTEVEIEAVSDQGLGSGSIRFGKDEPVAAEVRGNSAFLKLKPEANGFIDLTVVSSEWSLESRPPLRFTLVVVPDRSPSVSLAIEGESRVMTPKGRIGFKVEAEDDHGLSGLALLKVTRPVGDSTPEDELKPVTEPLEGRTEREGALVRSSAAGEIALEGLALAPGSSITLQAWTADNDALTGPKVATSEKETIVIVDPAELLRELEKVRVEAQSKLEDLSRREAAVRDRLEAIASGEEDAPAEEETPVEIASAGAAERAASSGRSPGGKRSASKRPAGKASTSPAGAEESPEEAVDSPAEEGGAEPEGAEPEGAAQASGKTKSAAKTARGKTAKGARGKGKSTAESAEAGEEPVPDGTEVAAEEPEEPGAYETGAESPGAQGKASAAKAARGKASKGARGKGKSTAEPVEAGEEPVPDGTEVAAEEPEEPGADETGAESPGAQGKASAAKRSGKASKGASSKGASSKTASSKTASKSSARPAAARASGQDASPSPDGAEEASDEEAGESPLSEMAREQQSIADESREVADRLRARSDALRRNSLIDPAEDRRLREEVEKPLDELAEERLPESAKELSSKTTADRVQETAAEAGREAEDLARELKKVADRLAGSGDFREVLLRMERILELQRQTIGETEKRGGSQ